jgi:hypothetical protein
MEFVVASRSLRCIASKSLLDKTQIVVFESTNPVREASHVILVLRIRKTPHVLDEDIQR